MSIVQTYPANGASDVPIPLNTADSLIEFAYSGQLLPWEVHITGVSTRYYPINGGIWDSSISAVDCGLEQWGVETTYSWYIRYGNYCTSKTWVVDHWEYVGLTYATTATWSFTTSTFEKAVNPTPADDAMNVDVSHGLTLTWEPGDPDNPPDSYSIYLDDELLEAGNTTGSYEHDGIGLSIFDNVWRVDSIYGSETVEGDDWTFSISVHFVITPAVNLTPADSETGVARTVLFTWSGGDVVGSFGGEPHYHVYLDGVFKGSSDTKFIVFTDLGYGKTYEWFVVTYAGNPDLGSYATGLSTTFTTAVLTGYPVPTGTNTVSQKRRLIAAAADRIWVEDI
jgi:hypothetical protein